MDGARVGYLSKASRDLVERRYTQEKRKQPGVAFPSAFDQEHLFIIRFDIADHFRTDNEQTRLTIRTSLKTLCTFFDRIDRRVIRLDQILDDGGIKTQPLSTFKFSATIGFGIGFFEKLNISQKNRPKNLKAMPKNTELGDSSTYSLRQTEFIIQLGAESDYVNRWVFQNLTASPKEDEKNKNIPYHIRLKQNRLNDSQVQDPPDIYTALAGWANITDIHAGFQRIDGKNLLGFNDGISNPDRLSNNVVWTTEQDEYDKFKDGTYMVFQKIEHDLERWQGMSDEKQEQSIGRSKQTGLLLGTLPQAQDRKLALDMHSESPLIQRQAMIKWKKLYKAQQDPQTRFFDSNQTQFKNIQLECPVWSHVRKANPRQADGSAKCLIFRRGYLYIDGGLNGKFNSGLLFICFQRNIEKSFEYIKKNFLNNKNFPVPQLRKNFNPVELEKRHQHGRLTVAELQKSSNSFTSKFSTDPDTHNTGKDGLSGPSELGIYPEGQLPVTATLGGGYYFIPPIPNKKISDISEQFFD